jgi:hypothetical protein
MAFGLLAGIAGAFPAIQRGIDDQKSRDIADEDRKYELERREAARADRAFGLKQRDRVVADQTRQDQMRTDLAAVPQTREVDIRPQEVREVTVDNEGTPSAAQIPATKAFAAPDWMKFKGQADAYRKGQDFEKADAYEALSKKAQFADAAQRFQRVRDGSGSMSLEQLAQAAGEIYNSDPLPAQIKGMKPVAGGLQFTFANSDTGESQTLVVKSKEELISKLESYYSPQTYAAQIQAQQAAALKRQQDLEKPEKLGPQEILVSGGKTIATNTNPSAAQVRAASAAGVGAKSTGQFKAISDAWENVAKNSGFKDQATPVQAAMSQRLARQFAKESGVNQDGSFKLDPGLAVEAAMDAVLTPDKLFPRYDPRTGEVVMAYQPASGGFMIAERLGSPKAPRNVKPEQMRKVASDFLDQLPDDDARQLFVGAASSPDGKRKLHEEVARRLSAPDQVAAFSRELGRPAEEADIERKVQEAIKALKPQLELLDTHLDPKIKSNAGKVVAKKAEIEVEGKARAAAAAKAAKLLANPSEDATKDLYDLQGSSEFANLDAATKAAIYKRVNVRATPVGGLFERR